MATAAAEEAPGKGIMEVQKVTGSSGPAQPKSLDGLPSDIRYIRQRPVLKDKPPTLEPVVSLRSSKAGDLASKKAAEKPENAGKQSSKEDLHFHLEIISGSLTNEK
ncbi:hypothetical protein OIU84_000183 [Salix udensis]|uniref:Uncharacterized protein n=1 Tax=Salix udensis TaxID=889485 RepID=A0AAD6L428_9ROSI|nr:hypothetical protein OIU84_000183 [Salix udensis]